jgi:hypothetical protein
MPVYKNIGGTVKRAKAVRLLTANGWKYVGVRAGTSLINYHRLVIISASTTDYNLKTALGNPALPVSVTVVVKSGVIIGATTTANAAFDTGALAAGSYVRLINSGSLYGMGGAGSNGASIVYPTVQNGNNGNAGGAAINLQCQIEIDNLGYIFGGGGGGAGGPSSYNGTSARGGSSGGGGQGYASSSHGSGGAASGGTSNTNGDANGVSTAGTQSAAGSAGYILSINRGGDGGAWGAAGAGSTYLAAYTAKGTEPSGGAAGNAVSLNSNAIGWISGNNASQVKGSVA